MDRDDVADLRQYKLRAHDVVIVILKDDVSEPSAEGVHELLQEFGADLDVTVLLFKERVFSDLSKAGLTSLLALQKRIEHAIAQLSTRDAKGDA